MASPKKETLEHSRAFDTYLAMGSDRTMAKLGLQLGKHENTIQAWAKRFQWAMRIEKAEIRIAAKVREKTEETIAEYEAKLVNVADAIMGIFVKRLRGAVDADGNLTPRGYKPSALDVKVWGELKRDIMSKSSGVDDEAGAILDAEGVDGIGFEKIERIVIERVERLARFRKRGAEGSGDVGMGTRRGDA